MLPYSQQSDGNQAAAVHQYNITAWQAMAANTRCNTPPALTTLSDWQLNTAMSPLRPAGWPFHWHPIPCAQSLPIAAWSQYYVYWQL